KMGGLPKHLSIYEIGFADIGEFTGDRRLSVRHGDLNAIELDCEFLHDGIPRRTMQADLPDTSRPERRPVDVEPQDALLRLLAHPTIASSESIVRSYDHEVMGGTTVRPYEGVEADGPSDGTVTRPIGTSGEKGIVLGIGVNALFGRLDAYRMARSVIDEAVRNVVAAGANPDRIAILDNFSWGDPTRPENLGTLVEAARGCYDGALSYLSPFISGKDSLYNEFVAPDGSRKPIPPTLVISALAMIDDVHDAVTTDLKRVGDHVFLLGETRDELGGSHLDDVLGVDSGGAVPGPVDGALDQYRRLHSAMSEGLIAACHDLSEGGLGVAAAEMCVGGRLGMNLRIQGDAIIELFIESNARFLVEVHPDDLERFDSFGLIARDLGVVAAEQRLVIDGGQWLVDLGIEQFVAQR
ncbi:MAG: AIR synthase-related protein, partial [Acidimicrobiales bacterium]